MEYEDPVTPPDLCVDVSSGRTEQLTFSNPPALAANALVTPEVVSYRAQDGLEIPAFLYRPAQPSGAAVMYPTAVPRLSMSSSGTFGQYLVAKGTLSAPNYRGSTGYGRAFAEANHFAWGKGDLQDCLVRRAFSTPWTGSTRRLASAGSSYGGCCLTAGVLSRDPDYLCACGVASTATWS
ncbi:MAG: prolyl oligopeptidase family serine peptidase [Caldilineaceae bacterium]